MLGVAAVQPVRRDSPGPTAAEALGRDHVPRREVTDAQDEGHGDEMRGVRHPRTYAEHRAILEAA